MKGLRNRNAGFTLIELMVVVAIIGVLVAIAVPSFLRYQLRAKRSEAYANLEAIATAETSYYATNGLFLNTGLSMPGGGVLSAARRPWTPAADTAFAPIGFRPEGNVYFDYDVNTACGASCFTATAYGDVDGDGFISALMYVHPDGLGAVAAAGLGLGLATPIENGVPVFNQVSWNTATADDF